MSSGHCMVSDMRKRRARYDMAVTQPNHTGMPQAENDPRAAQLWSEEIQYRPPQSMEMQNEMLGMIPNTIQGTLNGVNMAPYPGKSNPNFQTGLSQEQIENPVDTKESYLGSMKSLLSKNIGNYIVATFLVGTQSPVSWEGFLHSVGNDYLVIFQPDQGRYVTGDFYALKFVEFHQNTGTVPPCAGYRRRVGQQSW